MKYSPKLDQPILEHATKGYVGLTLDLTAEEALAVIRHRGLGERVVYFFVTDQDEKLVGVVPTRRLLMAPLEQTLEAMMIRNVVAIPSSATVMIACELFAIHRFLAMPVVDKERKFLGVVDVGLLTNEVLDMEDHPKGDSLFEAIGFHVNQVRDAKPGRAFRFRFPWLLATIFSGTLCALLASAFEDTLAKVIVISFFLPLVLGLGESISVQSMTVTIEALQAVKPTMRWYLGAFKRECGTSLLLGLGCGVIVGLIVMLWRQHLPSSLAIGGAVFGATIGACLIGLSIPALLHSLRLDPKIAAGPVTLALCDISTLLIYFGLATLTL